jgi:ribonuclease HI
MNKKIIAYTDGSASVAGKMAGQGGFGTFFPDLFGKKKAYSAGYKKAKVGQMEVCALLYAIRAMPEKCLYPVTLEVYSDSEYVVKTFTEKRLQKWILNSWTNSSGEVANKTLWIEIVKQLKKRKYMSLQMIHIRSHQVEKEKDLAKKEILKKDKHIRGNLVVDMLADYKRHTVLLKELPS